MRTAVDAGITIFEARTVEEKCFPLISGQACEILKEARKTYGIRYSAASPGLFIGAQIGSDLIEVHKNQLWSMSFEMAQKIGTTTLIVFAPQRSSNGNHDEEFSKVVDLLREVTESAVNHGFDVQLENLPGTWADTSDACLALLRAVDHRSFGYVWDTGNLYEAEQTTFEAGFEKLKPFIRNVHLKDGQFIDGKMVWQHFGTGMTDIAGQINALKTMGYTGTLALEAARIPHREGDFEASLAYLQSIL